VVASSDESWIVPIVVGSSVKYSAMANPNASSRAATLTIGNQTVNVIQTAGSGPLCASDLSSQVTITRGGFRFNHATNSFVQTISLTNNGQPLSGISLVLDNLVNATLSNAGGTTQCDAPLGSPWISVPGALGTGQSASITLTFSDPTMSGIQYSTRVLAGNGQQ
jgi:hypothetical protein